LVHQPEGQAHPLIIEASLGFRSLSMFVGYERPQASFQKREAVPYVSINKRSEIVLNTAAWKLLNCANYVQLFYDAETKRIGIAWPKQSDFSLKTFTLRCWGRGGHSRVVRARRFLNQCGIAITETLRFYGTKVEDGPMLVLDLQSLTCVLNLARTDDGTPGGLMDGPLR
jgi:hypothetical protein